MEDNRHVDGPVPYGSLERNGRHRFTCRVGRRSDGTDLRFPVNVVAGAGDGPRVVCVAGIHGDEPEGVTALLRLWDALEPDRIDGTVVLVPVANPPAFSARTRRNPDDSLDMNRSFPGDEAGTATERLARHLLRGVAEGADLVVSLHSMGTDSMVVPYVEYAADSAVAAASRAAAEAFGAPYVDPFEWPAGVFSKVCTDEGIPTIEPELGGLGATVPERRSQYVRGIRNVLRHAGALPGLSGDGEGRVPIADGNDPVPIERRKLAAPDGGVLEHACDLGEEVEAGDRLTRITDFGGRTVDEISAPADGIVGELRRTAAVHPGERVCTLFVTRK